MPHPRLFKRYGRYYFRAKVPAVIRGILDQSEIKKSLKTADYREAIRLCALESAKVDARFAKARRELDPRPMIQLTASQAEYLAVEWFHETDRRSVRENYGPPTLSNEEYAEQLKEDICIFSDSDSEQSLSSAQNALHAIAKANGIIVNFKNPAIERLLDLIRRGLREDARRQLRRMRSEHSNEGGDEFFRDINGERELKSKPPILLRELIRDFQNDRSETKSPKTVLKRASQLKLIVELIGENVPVCQITREQAKGLRDALRRVPRHAHKKFKHLSLREIVDLPQKANQDVISVTSANIYLSAFANLMEYAKNEGHISHNLVAGIRINEASVAKDDARDAFNTEQLTSIFDAPLYRGCADDQAGYNNVGDNHPRRGRFWVPLIALFTGMRLEEICQLRKSDIVKRDGVPVILVSSSGGRRVKTASGERYIPIHPELMKFGLLEFAANVCPENEGRLFPELTKAKSGYYSDNFSKWFGNFLRAAGAKTQRTSFHSFRHSFRDALREADVSRERVQALGGWASGKTEDNYGQGLRPKTLAGEIGKVHYDGLDLSHLHLRSSTNGGSS